MLAVPDSPAHVSSDTFDLLTTVDWRAVARTALLSRALDTFELDTMLPLGQAKYQFSAGGHELGQALLSQWLDRPFDAGHVYYRCRPFLLGSGLTPVEALLATLGKPGSPTDGRDLSAVYNLPKRGRAIVPPNAADIGAQYCVAAGWAQAIRYRVEQLGERDKADSVAVVYGGDGSVASSGFWAMLNVVTTLRLPILIMIEDNGYAISTRGWRQTPGANVAENLSTFKNLTIYDGDGTEPETLAPLLHGALMQVRGGTGPALVHLSMPRLCAHSGVDNAAYKSDEEKAAERLRDPLPKLERFCVEHVMSQNEWDALARYIEEEVREAYAEALARPEGTPEQAVRYAFSEPGRPQLQGGLLPDGVELPAGTTTPDDSEPRRLTMAEAIRRTLDVELHVDPRLLVFGEDVAVKGGVHSVTSGLYADHGEARVFDTSLNEEAIIGRAVGLALAGLMPSPEIQYRKYMDACYESLNNAGALRWRSANRFAAPMVVRTSGGYRKVGDPWHSVTSETTFAHMTGWRVAVPSTVADAVGLLRSALRANDPTIFFEHRFCYDSAWSRGPYPGDDYVVPFGVARQVRGGQGLTVIAWGAMVELCDRAADSPALAGAIDLLDLRTLVPLDVDAILNSVKRTGKCLIVHEDAEFAGFGAEIAALIADRAFFDLDAPIRRVAAPRVPVPFDSAQMPGVVPDAARIEAAMVEMLKM